MKVGDLMKTSVMTVDRGARLKNVARILTAFGISGLPVVDEGGAVVAVSKTDALMSRGDGRDVSVPFL
jgi:CBS domain-containing protein